ncbi:MAG TPA: FAD-dependent oxidoreductase [Pseudonocardiaceae bacterium]|nr:FAD-dependent oxidoreductase [Pseudonocardiaceae bacterium]
MRPEPATRTTCAIAGGGPAGMFLGLLLARAGIDVTVFEKHADFLRDFRGDTVHASTLQLLDELGLGAAFDALPHSTVRRVEFQSPGIGNVVIGDFGKLPGRYQHIAMVPQWDLLDLLSDAAMREPTFHLWMNTEVTGPIIDKGKVVGVTYKTADGETGQLKAALTVAADGRWSPLRTAMGMRPHEFPSPVDVWWFRMSKRDDDEPSGLRARITESEMGITIDRGDNYQIAYLNKKNFDPVLRAEGLDAFRARIAKLFPTLADRTDDIASLDDVKHLDVRVNRLRRWHVDGLLCIGDAAHAMSPIGGVGINLAIQDAVGTATLLAKPLLRNTLRVSDLAKVRRRRWLATCVVQALQRGLQSGALGPLANGQNGIFPRLPMLLFQKVPALRYLPGYLVAIGPRPEHAPQFARRSESPTPTPDRGGTL